MKNIERLKSEVAQSWAELMAASLEDSEAAEDKWIRAVNAFRAVTRADRAVEVATKTAAWEAVGAKARAASAKKEEIVYRARWKRLEADAKAAAASEEAAAKAAVARESAKAEVVR